MQSNAAVDGQIACNILHIWAFCDKMLKDVVEGDALGPMPGSFVLISVCGARSLSQNATWLYPLTVCGLLCLAESIESKDEEGFQMRTRNGLTAAYVPNAIGNGDYYFLSRSSGWSGVPTIKQRFRETLDSFLQKWCVIRQMLWWIDCPEKDQ